MAGEQYISRFRFNISKCLFLLLLLTGYRYNGKPLAKGPVGRRYSAVIGPQRGGKKELWKDPEMGTFFKCSSTHPDPPPSHSIIMLLHYQCCMAYKKRTEQNSLMLDSIEWEGPSGNWIYTKRLQ